MDLTNFLKLPLLGILRNINNEQLIPLTETILKSGLTTIEITMNTPHAPEMIKKMAEISSQQLLIGAGTVLSLEQMHRALEAEAKFIVMPTLHEDIALYCTTHKIPFFPGALTPTEIEKAWNAQSTMVKIFPAGTFGPRYIKDILGPFANYKLLACGGVNYTNIEQFFKNGAAGIAFGSSIFQYKLLQSNNYQEIGRLLKELIVAYNNISA